MGVAPETAVGSPRSRIKNFSLQFTFRKVDRQIFRHRNLWVRSGCCCGF